MSRAKLLNEVPRCIAVLDSLHGNTLATAASILNSKGVQTVQGGQWNVASVAKYRERYLESCTGQDFVAMREAAELLLPLSDIPADALVVSTGTE